MPVWIWLTAIVSGFCAGEDDVVWADAKKVEDRQAAKKAKTKFLMYQHPAELESPTYAKLDVRQIVSRCQEGKYWEPGKTSQWRISASILAQGIFAP